MTALGGRWGKERVPWWELEMVLPLETWTETGLLVGLVDGSASNWKKVPVVPVSTSVSTSTLLGQKGAT